ncbi:MAG TPA: hypothetical protein ENJ30_03320 [Desulfobulbaceae bacterium]|nr:hypothetical protein [Desulfobulbaceae bacterium]
MAKRILSLDIQEDMLCSVVVEQHGSELLVLACASIRLDDSSQLSTCVAELLARLDVVADGCVIGLPLSALSFRNLTLPFTDRKKMAQVLPLELEEQLLTPVDRQIIDFAVTGREEQGSRVMVAAVEKDMLTGFFPALMENGLPVRTIAVSLELLVRQYIAGNNVGNDPILFLHGGPHALLMALWADGQVVFMRRIAYPEPVFTTSLTENGEIVLTVDRKTAEQYMHLVCDRILSSLYYVGAEGEGPLSPQQVILSGCIAASGSWQSFFGRELTLPAITWEPMDVFSGMRLTESVQSQWNNRLYGSAFLLAVSGLQKKKNQTGLNFLKDEFAPGPISLFSRRSLTAIAAGIGLVLLAGSALLWVGYHNLDVRAADLHKQMVDIYKQTFPGATRVTRPYLQMKSRLQEVQGAEVALPLFSGEKRALTLLADISSRIPKDVTIHVSRLVIDRESVQMKGVTDAFNNVDVIKNKLAASPRYAEVKIVSAAADKKKGKIRFEIHLLLGEAS